MRKNIIQGLLLVVLLLGFAVPATALAGGGGKFCSNLGTWFGVSPFPPDPTSPPVPIPPPPWEVQYLTGWSVTVTGRSNFKGTNNFEFPVFDPSFAVMGLDNTPPFSDAVRVGSMRGNWKRTGRNTFDYTFMGFAFNAAGMPVYVAKISGQVVLVENCQYQHTTAVMEVFLPWKDPFHHEYDYLIPLGEFYGYRATVVDPPELPGM